MDGLFCVYCETASPGAKPVIMEKDSLGADFMSALDLNSNSSNDMSSFLCVQRDTQLVMMLLQCIVALISMVMILHHHIVVIIPITCIIGITVLPPSIIPSYITHSSNPRVTIHLPHLTTCTLESKRHLVAREPAIAIDPDVMGGIILIDIYFPPTRDCSRQWKPCAHQEYSAFCTMYLVDHT